MWIKIVRHLVVCMSVVLHSQDPQVPISLNFNASSTDWAVLGLENLFRRENRQLGMWKTGVGNHWSNSCNILYKRLCNWSVVQTTWYVRTRTMYSECSIRKVHTVIYSVLFGNPIGTLDKLASVQAGLCMRMQSKPMSYSRVQGRTLWLWSQFGNNNGLTRSAYVSSAFLFLFDINILSLSTRSNHCFGFRMLRCNTLTDLAYFSCGI